MNINQMYANTLDGRKSCISPQKNVVYLIDGFYLFSFSAVELDCKHLLDFN